MPAVSAKACHLVQLSFFEDGVRRSLSLSTLDWMAGQLLKQSYVNGSKSC